MSKAEDTDDEPIERNAENTPPGDYIVGYGKPPRATQFKKGQSGNSKGRPLARTDLSGLLAEALDEQIRTTSGGVEKNVSKQRAVLTALINRALKNDPRALRSLTKLAEKTGNLALIPDYRDHIPVVTLTYDEMKEYDAHPERRDQLIEQAEERGFKRRAETNEALRRFNQDRGRSSS